ncbi:hypothetical protein BDY17DRAFT_290391 [Neohortaea acidophila]|uniref:Uncharacterized protein n=1 Tax=Neohortaea acidophila TaxID=245834 RepID=A0A6A6Q8C9_9PEZI|nr:uncharacterized protein BDY17DRAFT_290391 [Neohortaea acidophila]KAF2488196.1 hypothetical protein BDY17DRAFT_290391 [Neohortaea acidophila]
MPPLPSIQLVELGRPSGLRPVPLSEDLAEHRPARFPADAACLYGREDASRLTTVRQRHPYRLRESDSCRHPFGVRRCEQLASPSQRVDASKCIRVRSQCCRPQSQNNRIQGSSQRMVIIQVVERQTAGNGSRGLRENKVSPSQASADLLEAGEPVEERLPSLSTYFRRIFGSEDAD